MLFNSFHFLCFFPIVLLIYFIIPRKIRYIWLLACSYYFYMAWNPKYAILIAISTVTTFLSGIFIEKLKRKKLVVAFSFIINLGILFFFKYFDFALDSVNYVLSNFNITAINNPFDIILPVGISFYSFQALGYTIDVYRGKLPACKNIFKYALFVSFFPQLVAGPIERSDKLLAEIEDIPNRKGFDIDKVKSGLIIMLWGYFMKMMIADRASVFVDAIFDTYWCRDSISLVAGVTMFAVQIYCDFASYSTIAIGSARVMNIDIMENFDTPYFAMSIKEFWRRWHISLSTWFRDYLYIPLGGNRKGKARKYFNLMLTFLVSGLWHGAAWNFVFWGALHGAYQIIGEMTQKPKEKLIERFDVDKESLSYKFFKILGTFVLVNFGWIFFRSSSISAAFTYVSRIFTRPDPWSLFDKSLFGFGLNSTEMQILIVSIIVLLLVDLIKYKRKENLDEFLSKQNSVFAYAVLIVLFMAIFIFGAYGRNFDPQAFIYFQF
ncbi:MAG TPA: MBOAT family protein [Clostridiales bacterium]|nr:MBOAT family protein [Clostridiales bacterium]